MNFLKDILTPDWKKIGEIRSKSQLPDIFDVMKKSDTISFEDVSHFTWSPEDLAMFVIRSHAGLKWRLAEAIHKCGRFQACQIFWTLATKEAEKKGYGKANDLKAETIDEAKILDHVTFFMHRADKEICSDINDIAESLLMTYQLICEVQDKNTEEDWQNLDWPSLFHAVGSEFDVEVISLFINPDDNSTKNKFEDLVNAAKLSVNNGDSLTPEIRSEIEQTLTRTLGTIEPFGVEEKRFKAPTAWGFCV